MESKWYSTLASVLLLGRVQYTYLYICHLREAAKKIKVFFSGPLGQWPHFLGGVSKKVLSSQLPPTPLDGRATKKRFFLRLHLVLFIRLEVSICKSINYLFHVHIEKLGSSKTFFLSIIHTYTYQKQSITLFLYLYKLFKRLNVCLSGVIL